jgi:RNA 3'-terminal phosphate cyclase (ATP)
LRLRHRGRLQEIRGRAVVANLPGHIAERMARTATRVLAQRGMKSQITADRVDSRGRGAAIYMTARYQHSVAGFSAIGRRGVPSEAVAEEACRRLLTHDASGAPIDPHLADQLLLPAAFSKGPVSFECSQITQHLTTAAHIISRFLSADVRIAGEANQPGTVTVGPNVRRTS